MTTAALPDQLALWDPTSYGYTLRLPALPDAPKNARTYTTATLAGWGLDVEHIGNVVLIISELVTNAVEATGRATGPLEPLPGEDIPNIRVSIKHYIKTTSIVVWDNDPTPPTLLEPNPDAEQGRGLYLVSMIAKEWRHYPDRGGKTIWCRIDTS